MTLLDPVLRGRKSVSDVIGGDSLKTIVDTAKNPIETGDLITASMLLGDRLHLNPTSVISDWDYVTRELFGDSKPPAFVLQQYRPAPQPGDTVFSDYSDPAISKPVPVEKSGISNTPDFVGPPDPFANVAKEGETVFSVPDETPGPARVTEPSQDRYKNFRNEWARSWRQGSLMVTAPMVDELAKSLQVSAADAWVPILQETASAMRAGMKERENRPTTGGGIPAYVAQSVAQTIPFTAMAAAGSMVAGATGGGPLASMAGAFYPSFLVEGDGAYWEAIEAGADEETAQLNRFFVGTINGSIEILQVGGVVNLAKTGSRSFFTVSKLAQQKAMSKAAAVKQGGKTLTAALLTSFTEQAIEESLQETSSILALDRVQKQDLADSLNRIFKAGIGGGTAGIFLGGSGHIMVRAGEALTKPQTVQDIQQQPGAGVSRPGRAELKQQLTQNAQNISEEQAELAMQILDAAAAAGPDDRRVYRRAYRRG